jgi:drug/metabolite transporter superfamily protein YnfA
MKIIYSIVLFILAGLCEIGGSYLIWLWLREGKAWWYLYNTGYPLGVEGRWHYTR